MTRPVLILLATSGLLSCAEEPLPQIKASEAVVVAPWDIPDVESLREALVRAYLADSLSSVPIVYCVQFCEFDESKGRCRPYDPSQSFFARFREEGLPIFASYRDRPQAPAGTQTRRMLIGPFWREPRHPYLLAEVGDSLLWDRLPESGAIYSARWGRGGWRVVFRDPPPP